MSLMDLVKEPEEVREARLLCEALGVPYDYVVRTDAAPGEDHVKVVFSVIPKPITVDRQVSVRDMHDAPARRLPTPRID